MTADPNGTAAEPARPGGLPAAGENLGKYRLDRVIGAGGMGVVWAAFDPDLERAVAIKLLRAAGDEPTLRARLLREARAMARLKHPNVLTVYEVGTVHNRDYIAMELVDGESLDAWLAARPPREQVAEALLAAGRGLAAAHAAGLVHRDFKPHNVLRSRDGHVYVTDFGLARGQIEQGMDVDPLAVTALPDDLAGASQFPRRALDSVLDSPLTQTGVLIGTPAYMAPEQFAGRVPDARSDQFGFCVTAWEALTGARPFRGSTLTELEAAMAAGVRGGADSPGIPATPRRPAVAWTLAGEAALPPAVREVLARGLDPSPDARWPDLPALLRALGAALAEAPARPRAPRRRWLVAAGAVGAAAIAVAVGFTAVRHGGGSRADGWSQCDSPEQAFGDAWSPARRAAVIEAHPTGALLGASAVLDKARQSWLRSFRAACAAPRTEAGQAAMTCLIEARDALARTTSALRDRATHLDMSSLVEHITAVAVCDAGRRVRGAFDGEADLDPDLEPDLDPEVDPHVPIPPAPIPPAPIRPPQPGDGPRPPVPPPR